MLAATLLAITLLRPDPDPLTLVVRSSLVRFAQLAEAGIVGICIGNVHGDIFEANDAFLNLLDAITRTGAAEPWEAELVHKDGHRIPVIIGVAPLDYPNTIALFTDLTPLRRREDAVRQAERMLDRAQKMDALANLAGEMAHEFNNLLGVILGYTGMLAADLAANDPMLDVLDEIRTAGERAAALRRQLLTLSPHQLLYASVFAVGAILRQGVIEPDAEVLQKPFTGDCRRRRCRLDVPASATLLAGRHRRRGQNQQRRCHHFPHSAPRCCGTRYVSCRSGRRSVPEMTNSAFRNTTAASDASGAMRRERCVGSDASGAMRRERCVLRPVASVARDVALPRDRRALDVADSGRQAPLLAE